MVRLSLLMLAAGCGFSGKGSASKADAPPIIDANPFTTRHSADADTFLHESYKTLNYGGEDDVIVDGDGVRAVGLLRFETLELPTSTVVQAARVHLFVTRKAGDAIDLHAITEPWDETTTTWVMRDAEAAWTTPGGAPGTLVGQVDPGLPMVDHVVEIDLATVQAWVTNPTENYGLALISSGLPTWIGSKESVDRPYLEITRAP